MRPSPLHSLPLYESMVRAAARAGIHRAGKSGLISTRATQLFEETIKTMFLTKLRTSVALALLAGCLAAGAAGVFAQRPGQDGKKAASGRAPRGKTAAGPSGTAGRRSRERAGLYSPVALDDRSSAWNASSSGPTAGLI